ncbi:MAG TPA: hypothetical protein VGF08_11585 [Terriglobales bacterium]|jgi:CheY-like chemotaxis protein
MTAPVIALPASDPANIKKKRVLLVDSSQVKRDVRSETMRRLGIEVDCAADITEARCWWRPDLYDLVLLHIEGELLQRDKFCDDIRTTTPGQQIAFLVGKPEYLASSPGTDGAPVETSGHAIPYVQQPLANSASPKRWGILEACQRISAVRSVTVARSKALRDRPLPPRDPEAVRSKPSRTFAEMIQREEMQ